MPHSGAFASECFSIIRGVGEMTSSEKERIAQYRNQGMGFTEISKLLGISINTVKSYCRRNNIAVLETKPIRVEVKQPHGTCKQCGVPLYQTEHHRERLFCSDKCRMKWWHNHRSESRRAVDLVCPTCGTSFRTDRDRKYCSHACYIAARFGG